MSSPITRGRPRRTGLDDAILTATLQLLREHGAGGTTVDAVARAAGTTKAAIYRRWPGKNDLVVAAVRSLSQPPEVPDTGGLRDDLLVCALRYTRADPGAMTVLRGVLGDAVHDPELSSVAYEVLGRPPAQAIVDVLHRAVDRGDVPADAPIDLVAGIVPAVAFRTLVAWGHPLDVATATDLVDHVVLPSLGLAGR